MADAHKDGDLKPKPVPRRESNEDHRGGGSHSSEHPPPPQVVVIQGSESKIPGLRPNGEVYGQTTMPFSPPVGPEPMPMTCYNCKKPIITKIVHDYGLLTVRWS